jgi:hypothetical protein
MPEAIEGEEKCFSSFWYYQFTQIKDSRRIFLLRKNKVKINFRLNNRKIIPKSSF